MNILKQKFAAARGEPIIDSPLHNDMYKFHMMYFTLKQGVHNTPVISGLFNRSKTSRFADVVPKEALQEQLDHIKQLRISAAKASFLQGLTTEVDGKRELIYPDPTFTDHLLGLRLCDYELAIERGEYKLTFDGGWYAKDNCSSLWEIPASTTLSELGLYYTLKRMYDNNDLTMSEIEHFFNRMHTRLVEGAKIFTTAPSKPTMSPQGLRRAASVQHSIDSTYTLMDLLGPQCVGPSDVQLAMDIGSANPIGTVAHETSIVWPTLCEDTDDAMRESQFKFALAWADTFPPPLRNLLPDTYGSKQFFDHAPAEIATLFPNYRPDSMTTEEADVVYSKFLERHGVDKAEKGIFPSDGQTLASFPAEHARFSLEYARCSAGIGGDCTANFKGLIPGVEPANIVIKPIYANGRPTVKIGDTPNGGKLTGVNAEHNKRALHVFSEAGWAEHKTAIAA